MDHIFANESFLYNTRYCESPVFTENYNIINIRAIAYKLIFLQAEARKSFLPVDIQFLSGCGNCRGFYTFEVAEFGLAFPACSIFFADIFVKGNHKIRQMIEVVLYLT